VFPRARQRRPDAVAVIIGNGSYRNGVPSVEFSGRDAEAMKLVAVKTLGLDSSNILFLKDATRGQMDEVFGTDKDYKGKLWRTIDPDGRSDVYVFYSGHGVPGTNEVEGTFLLPIDGDPNHASLNGYPLKQLYKNLSELKTKSVTVFLDACFSGQAADQSGTPLINNASPVFIAKATTPGEGSKINVFAAAGERQLSSWDPEVGHGIFTRYVLSGLAGDADTDKNRDITAKELREYVTRQVRKAARRMHGRDQEPSFAGDDNFVLSSF
jgi:Caspase domain